MLHSIISEHNLPKSVSCNFVLSSVSSDKVSSSVWSSSLALAALDDIAFIS